MTAAVQQRRVGFDRFDLILGSVLAGLLIAIVAVIVAGDRAGVGVALIDPLTDRPAADSIGIPSTAALRLRFTEPMDTASVHWRIAPLVVGALSWSGSQAIFRPQPALTPGQTYTLTLDAGAKAANGRVVRQTASWRLHVAPLGIVYLAPALRNGANVPTNLWRVTPPGAPEPLTHSAFGVQDFAPSPDGTRIAFSDADKTGKTDVWLLTLATGAVRPLTHCVDAPCRAPAWNPDGSRLVYERADSTRPDSDVRAWLLDLATLQTAPLLADSRWLGKNPHWSPDGKTIAVYDRNAGGIALIDVTSGQTSLIPTLEDLSGQFAPSAQQLAFAQLAMTPQGAIRQLVIADFSSAHTLRPLPSPDGALTDDAVALWQPDGQRLVVMRRYFDDRATQSAQLYAVDAATGDAAPLVVDAAYAQGYPSWSPDGGSLLMQRYATTTPNAQPGIWTYNQPTKALIQVAVNGFFPQWLP